MHWDTFQRISYKLVDLDSQLDALLDAAGKRLLGHM